MTVTQPTTPENAAKAAEYRAMAAGNRQEAEDSFERCDTDGFLSQWAHGQMANRYHYIADMYDNNGLVRRIALFDLEGNFVPAKYIETRYGWSWKIQGGGFFNESKAQKEETQVANNAKKGFYVGSAWFEGKINHGSYQLYVEDYAAPVEVIDNGQ